MRHEVSSPGRSLNNSRQPTSGICNRHTELTVKDLNHRWPTSEPPWIKLTNPHSLPEFHLGKYSQTMSNLWWPGGSLFPVVWWYADLRNTPVGLGNSFHRVTGPRTQTITKPRGFLRRTFHHSKSSLSFLFLLDLIWNRRSKSSNCPKNLFVLGFFAWVISSLKSWNPTLPRRF